MAEERTQRRLAAILAADVVGYSRLIGTDEEGTLAALKAHWRELTDPKVEQHHGRVVKTTGDGALIEFASVVDAVRFAVDVQRGTVERNVGVPPDKRIEFRIGINVGDIVIDGDDILGDGVNIAARLEGLAEPGGVLVSRAVRDQVRDRLELAFEDLGEREFKNIARPVRVYRVRLDEVATRRSAAVKRSHIWKWTIAAGAAVVLMASATLWSFYSREPSAPSPSVTSQPTIIAAAPSIAVLPFANMSGDPALDYFADGVTDTMIAGLSRSPAIRVVARTSTAVYKGKAIDVRQISKELGVRYVLEGSVQKGTDELRIVAQLIDGGTGDHVWGERYDREGTDALALQDEVVEKVIGTLAGNHGLIRKKEYEQSWGKDRASLEEYDYYPRGHHLWDRFTREDTHEAIAIWQQGARSLPRFIAPAYQVGLGLFPTRLWRLEHRLRRRCATSLRAGGTRTRRQELGADRKV
jgi:adenylate cyclase